MCGIAAIVSSSVQEEEVLGRALDLVEHRGPDDRGTWRCDGAWLGSRRLAILDVTSRGHQPMRLEPSLIGVFNGEIYNYVELRKELEGAGHRFRTGTDTEVLLHAYQEWGEKCLDRLNGMWAFVIWDESRRRAFFARDRFGVKPFYFTLHGGGFAMASEPKVLLAIWPELRRPNLVTLYRLLAEKRLELQEQSFYEGIQVLPPGSMGSISVGDRAPTIRTWYRLPEAGDEDDGVGFEEDVERFGALLADAVRMRLRSDVAVGITLSGGLDSTAILHEADVQVGGRDGLAAYTAVYGASGGPGHDEWAWALEALRGHRCVQLHAVEAEAGDWLDILRRIVWHMDGPGYSPAVFPLWKIMERAHGDDVPVLLEGQGADELLGGYVHHRAAAFVDDLRNLPTREAPARARSALLAVREARHSSSVKRFLADAAVAVDPRVDSAQQRHVGVRDALDPEFAALAAATPSTPRPHGAGRLDRTLRNDFSRETLPGFLHYGDAVSMAHSVEARHPFLDVRLVEFVMRLPPDRKLALGRTKVLLRAHLQRRGQVRIANRRDKRGFPTPANRWLARDNGAVLRDLLLNPRARVAGLVRRQRLERLIERHVDGRFAAGDQLYALVAAELWLEECVSR
jgi:asparagine synthase (glutamine-hydrolysing)